LGRNPTVLAVPVPFFIMNRDSESYREDQKLILSCFSSKDQKIKLRGLPPRQGKRKMKNKKNHSASPHCESVPPGIFLNSTHLPEHLLRSDWRVRARSTFETHCECKTGTGPCACVRGSQKTCYAFLRFFLMPFFGVMPSAP